MIIFERIKSSPWGLRVIVLLFGIEMIRGVIEVLHGPDAYKIINGIIAILFLIGLYSDGKPSGIFGVSCQAHPF